MKKLLQSLDNSILKIGVIFTSLFIVLYPKLPSIYITHTWVYVRLEDFVISFLIIIWFVQLIRRKVKLALPLGIPILIYWIVGLLSVVYSILFIGPHLIDYFPKLVELEYLRRVEYMILFFVGFSAIQSRRDLKQFISFLLLGLSAVILYGFGQHFYPYFWNYIPSFLQKTNFCFPSFQTGNEEFAKGIPLCLPVGSRVTSTFGGHYDLAGYLIIVLPIVLGLFLFAKKKLRKLFLGSIFVFGLIILILTSSRSAFLAYLFAAVIPLIFLKKKKFIVPVLVISFLCLVLFSQSTINRFMQTFRITSVVVNMQGQVVGLAENSLSQKVQNQLKQNNKVIQATQVVQGVVPEGSSFITLPQQRIATSTAVVQQGISGKSAQQLQLANGGLELSTIKGNFSVQQALVYDISVTTRLQGEWPNAISAFLHYPLLGQGYSTLTLAVDNDFLRLLGESGILGFIAFIAIFVVLGIIAFQILPNVDDPLLLAFSYGLMGGVIGLFVNATLFDIFESSKVAETLWLSIGLCFGSLMLYKKYALHYLKPLWTIITSRFSLYIYLVAASFGVYWVSISQFFVGDDFVWLKWAATSTFNTVPSYFTQANGFFYRPLDKLIMLLLYSVFAFNQQGYHVVILILLCVMAIGVYLFSFLLLGKKLWSFVAAALFILLPMHLENIMWISSLSIDLSAVFVLFAVIAYLKSNMSKRIFSGIFYGLSIVLSILGLLSYELSVVIPLLLIALDAFVSKKLSLKRLWVYVPFVLLDLGYFVMRVVSHALRAGGDYSYNLVHFIPNVAGNLLGYAGLFIFGEWSLPWYTLLRTGTKHLFIPLIIILLTFAAVGVFYLKKKNLSKFSQQYSLPLFAITFSLISLLPYLGLGNIAERYGYLASAGGVILIVLLCEKISKKINNKILRYIVGGVVAVVIITESMIGLSKGFNEWKKASTITYTALGYFKIEYPTLPVGSTLIIVDRPIRYGNAWIFPTGLPEGLWFIYGDTMPKVIDAANVDAAKQTLAGQQNVYRFLFLSNNKIEKIK